MKTCWFLILCLASFQGLAQRKDKNAPDPKNLKIDSLIKANDRLTKKLDSTSKDRTLYFGVYTTIREKVLLHDFDPAKISQIVDSLKKGKDATITGLTSASNSLRDSLTSLNKQNVELKAKTDGKAPLIAELKQLKDLLDGKMISQADYDAKKKLVMDKWQ